MKLTVDLSKAEYLYHMQDNMGGHFEFGRERFTGFFLGPLFHVTYHSGYEWNRRITNQKNTAVGYVKKADSGCDVHFLRFRGVMAPMQFLSLLLPLELYAMLSIRTQGVIQPTVYLCIFVAVLGLLLVAAALSAFFESLTEQSEEGRRSLLSFLMNPKDPYGLYSKIP